MNRTPLVLVVTLLEISALGFSQTLQNRTATAKAELSKQEKAEAKPALGLTVADVQAMLQSGLSEELVIVKLRKENHPFDLTPQQMLELKKTGTSDNVIKVMMDPTASVAPAAAPAVAIVGVTGAKTSGATPGIGTSEAAIAANLNNPDAPHDSGIYMFTEKNNEKIMIALERASYQGTKTGGILGHSMTGGLVKAKNKAVIPGPRASIRTGDPRPVFYFYFEDKSAGLGKATFGAQTVSNPNQFALLKLEVRKGNRETVTGTVGFASVSTGTDEKAMIAFKAERLRPGVYRAIPTANMEPGEYCFLASGFAAMGAATAMDIFDFGVTPNQ